MQEQSFPVGIARHDGHCHFPHSCFKLSTAGQWWPPTSAVTSVSRHSCKPRKCHCQSQSPTDCSNPYRARSRRSSSGQSSRGEERLHVDGLRSTVDGRRSTRASHSVVMPLDYVTDGSRWTRLKSRSIRGPVSFRHAGRLVIM